jgi:hypothetical protein
MPDVPRPVNSAPPLPWQPYDATAPGAAEDQTAPTTIYNPVAGDAAGGPWRKIQEAGAAGPGGEATPDSWPGNGSSGDGGWTQV